MDMTLGCQANINADRHPFMISVDALVEVMGEFLAGGVGKTPAHWIKVIGDVATFPITRHTRLNWSVEPKGSAADVASVRRAVEFVRVQYPIVDHRP
jgi:hypothetical protein